MKRLLVVLLIATLLTTIWLLSPIGTSPAALLCLGRSDHSRQAPPQPQLYTEGEEALKQSRTDDARRLIAQGLATARDSDEHYRYEVLRAKLYFATMQADSFALANARLGAYLSALKGKPTEAQRLLKVEYWMQRGVYETKMVGRMDTAQACNLRALQLAEALPYYTDNRLVLLTNIADVYKQTGQYDESVAYFRRAMELGDSVGMSDATRITLDIGIASAYAAMGSFEQSSVWWDRAAQLRPRMQRAELFHYLNNRGNDYYLQGLYHESLGCFLELDSLIAHCPDMVWERMFEHCNLSDVYIKIGQPERALPLLDETEPFFREQQQLIPLYYLATQRIELALLSGNTAQAESLSLANPTPQWMIPEQKVLRQKVLLGLYKATGRWQQYALSLQSLQQLQDSIAGDNMKMRFSEALMHYEHEKQMLHKQRQIEEKDLSFRWAVAMLVAAAVVIALLVVLTIMKQRERRVREMAMRSRIAGLRMETVRNRITPHFISNALTAEMLAQMDGKPADLDSLVQLLHRGIEFTGTEQTTLADELRFIDLYCDIESRSMGPDFSYVQQVAPDVDAGQVLLPSMSVQILVENALKHGLKARAPQPGKLRQVAVKATRTTGGTLVEVTDNGVGLPPEGQHNEGTGLRVVRQTILMLNEQNRQQMSFALQNRTDGEPGSHASLFLPDDYCYTLSADTDSSLHRKCNDNTI